MTATTPAPSTPATAARAPLPQSAVHPFTRLVGPVALVVGSVMAVLGQGLHITDTGQDVGIATAIADAPGAWMASHLLLGFGFALIAIGAATALPRHRGGGAALTAAGAVILSLGAAVMALGDIAHGALGFALVGPVDVATSFEIQSAYYEGPMAPGLNLGAPLLSIGMILLGAGLLGSRRHPRWVGIVVAVSPLLVLASFNLGLPTFLNLAPMAVGLAVLASALLRGSRPWPRGAATP